MYIVTVHVQKAHFLNDFKDISFLNDNDKKPIGCNL